VSAADIIRRHIAELEHPNEVERRQHAPWMLPSDLEAMRARAELTRKAELRRLRRVLAEVEAETGGMT